MCKLKDCRHCFVAVELFICDATCQNQALVDNFTKNILLQIQIEEIHSFKMTSTRTVYLTPGLRYYTFSVHVLGITVLRKAALKNGIEKLLLP